MTIGVSTAIAQHNKYDVIETLLFAFQEKIEVIQIYLDTTLMNNSELIQQIREIQLKKNATIICHAPESLNNKILSHPFLPAAHELLRNETTKRIIMHFDEHMNISQCIELIRSLNAIGFTVCLENYYQKTDLQGFLCNHLTYLSLCTTACTHNLNFQMVLDLPRLFTKELIRHCDPIGFAYELLMVVSIFKIPLIWHLIDFNDFSQKRNTWCEIGSGLMPYEKIFAFHRSLSIQDSLFILEYEDKEMFLKSIGPLKSMSHDQ